MFNKTVQAAFWGHFATKDGGKQRMNFRLGIDPPAVELHGYGGLDDPWAILARGGLSSGTVRGRLHTGERVVVDRCWPNANVRGDGATEIAFSFAHLTLQRTDTRWPKNGYTGWVKSSWQLSSSGLLHETAKVYLYHGFEHLSDLVADHEMWERLQKRRRDRANPLKWNTSAGVEGEFCIYERPRPVSPHPLGYAERPTAFYPIAIARAYVCKARKHQVIKVFETLDTLLEGALEVLSLLQGHRVAWVASERALMDGSRPVILEDIYKTHAPPPVTGRSSRRNHLGGILETSLSDALAELIPSREFIGTAIVTYLDAIELPPVSQFIMLSTALETLKSLYQHESSSEYIIERRLFEKVLRRELKAVLKDGQLPDASYTAMSEKLGDVNRPAYARVLHAMAQDWGVDLSGIAIDGKFGFIAVRNSLVHAGRFDDWQTLFDESRRLRALVERAIAARLRLKVPSRSSFGQP